MTAVVETPGDAGVGGPAVVVAVDGVSVRFGGGVSVMEFSRTAVVETLVMQVLVDQQL